MTKTSERTIGIANISMCILAAGRYYCHLPWLDIPVVRQPMINNLFVLVVRRTTDQHVKVSLFILLTQMLNTTIILTKTASHLVRSDTPRNTCALWLVFPAVTPQHCYDAPPTNQAKFHLKAKTYAISSDTHQLQLIKLHHFKLERFKSIQ